MKKALGIVAASAFAITALSAPATAAPPAGAGEGGKPAGIACQQAGIGTLQELGLLSAVAKGGIEVVPDGNTNFQTVLKLHRTMPELFQTGTPIKVVVPGVGTIAPTWCDVE